jgi:hypothetical protein
MKYAVVAYKQQSDFPLDVQYEDVSKWLVRDGFLILQHEKTTTIIPLAAFESCDIREEKE